ncbi:Di-copper centre-containing protein [Echria macrotheca]|uniref:Di-copper centre-containing protein n=1 Tax=Echria macrotheca TaxID=438768 RepID=A0AAJ0BKJ1_9PEZI|nr:Di-copper centre-containing protein [Echria macrotheca]
MGKITARLGWCVAAALLYGHAAAQTAQQTPFPVVGVRTGIDVKTGQRPARQNINDLYARGGPQWDLYILALSAFQDVNETDPLSYYAISGIHGLPHSAWNGVAHVDGAPKDVGYCPHNELLFPTWHRPYVALFEQALVSHAVRIASGYPSATAPAYKAAAQTLRQPYWDWAAEAKLPTAATLLNITVNGPGGPVTLRNPLYSYRFQRLGVLAAFGGTLSQSPETVRCGGLQGNNGTESDRSMMSVAKDLTNYVYDVFTRTQKFEDMAYDNFQGSSFENPHNIVHNNAGCGGTLGNIDWSAFDPLFMLHHCNVDRLISLWQAIHYDTPMFTVAGRTNGEFSTASGSNITADSPLKPFFDKNLNFYSSNSVSDIRVFGYTYPEIDDWSRTPDVSANFVRSRVNALYGGSSSSAPVQRRGFRPLSFPPFRQRLQYYTAEIQVDRSEIPLPSTVHLMVNGSAVGRMALLAMPRTGMASVSLPLRGLAVGNQSFESVDPSAALDFLREELTLEIRTNEGVSVSVDIAPSLKLEVQGVDYKPRADDNGFPSFGNSTKWPVRVRPSRY